ncbi:MAG: hypothetical protein AAF610_13040 [Pseudomonadota bacterium]
MSVVSLGDVTGVDTLTLPVTARIDKNQRLGATSFAIYFDPAVVELAHCRPDTGGLFSQAMCNQSEPGVVRVSAVSLAGVGGKMSLAVVEFVRRSKAAALFKMELDVFATVDGTDIPVEMNNLSPPLNEVPHQLGRSASP